MPRFPFRKTPEDAFTEGPGSEPIALRAALRPHKLTQELLDWAIAALETVITTPEVQKLAAERHRSYQALREAYIHLDHLYPKTLSHEETPADEQ